MDGLHVGKSVQDFAQTIVPRGLRVLHFSHVELPNARNLPAAMADGRRLALRSREDDIDEVTRAGHHWNLLEIIEHHGG